MKTLAEFWSHVDKTHPDGCWVWIGATQNGYGRLTWGGHGRRKVAHRVAYESLVGPVPDGLVLDHLCRNRACVNPKHLEPVSSQVNVLRGVGWGAANARKTHCSRGHAYDLFNTRWRKNDGGRECRTCARLHAIVDYFRKLNPRFRVLGGFASPDAVAQFTAPITVIDDGTDDPLVVVLAPVWRAWITPLLDDAR